jgi:CxxC motif-containing protein (DUF1111 family)
MRTQDRAVCHRAPSARAQLREVAIALGLAAALSGCGPEAKPPVFDGGTAATVSCVLSPRVPDDPGGDAEAYPPCEGEGRQPPREPADAAVADAADGSPGIDLVRARPGTDLAAFARGRALFERTFTPQDGLGPVYNGLSCASCHNLPGLGGEGDYEHRSYEGSARFRLDGSEIHHPESEGYLIAPSVFGFGDLDEIPAAEVARRCGTDPALGIHGRPGRNLASQGVTRFGRKLRVATLLGFVAVAFGGELGINNHASPEFPRLEGVDPDAPVEIGADAVRDVAAFVAGLDAPASPFPSDPGGERLFAATGCATCHRVERGWHGTDLCSHDLGPGLDFHGPETEGLGQTEWRTAPLAAAWSRHHFLHDGRADGLDAAVRLHGGEAAAVVARYARLSGAERAHLLGFVKTL